MRLHEQFISSAVVQVIFAFRMGGKWAFMDVSVDFCIKVK